MAARRKYNWEDWFSRPITILKHGEDYYCSQSSISNMIRNAASRYKVKVSMTDCGDSIAIRVRRNDALPHTDSTTITNQHSPVLA